MKHTFVRGAFWYALFSVPILSYANPGSVQLVRQYPVANAFEVPPVTTIGLTAPAPYDRTSLSDAGLRVIGSRSGVHTVEWKLSDDRATLIVSPSNAFAYNEAVTVVLRARLMTGKWVTDSFQFRTMRRVIPSGTRPPSEWLGCPAADTASADTLPPITVMADSNATPGIIYFTNFQVSPTSNNTFLLNLDQNGSVVREQDLGETMALDFKRQPNGLITYFNSAACMYYGLDSNWNVADSFPSANGYALDWHELRVFSDGGYALLATSMTTLDSSEYVLGMNPNATVFGDVIQIFDAHGNETFEWRGIDHYHVADAVHQDLTQSALDFEHANALDFDSAGNVLISNRYLCELTQIDRSTGRMLWRLGGVHNEFQLAGDSIWFSYQHAPRWLPNGHLILFDNANFDSVSGEASPALSGNQYLNHSRAIEYAIDTVQKVATLVWQYHHTPETYTYAMGDAERLPNGNTFIAWGMNRKVSMTEVRPDGSTAFEVALGKGNYSYRAFKYLTPVAAPASVSPALTPIAVQLERRGSAIAVDVSLDRAERVTLSCFDALGRSVTIPIARFEPSGRQVLPLPVQHLTPGTYYAVLRTDEGRLGSCGFSVP